MEVTVRLCEKDAVPVRSFDHKVDRAHSLTSVLMTVKSQVNQYLTECIEAQSAPLNGTSNCRLFSETKATLQFIFNYF